MSEIATLGLIAGNGIYPLLVARAARQRGVREIHVAAFASETRPDLADAADTIEWLRVGQLSRLDIGQTVVIRHGTILAVEAFEGTNEAIRRGAALGKGIAVVVKVSKPDQDFRFDVPVIGCQTIETAAEAGVKLLAIEAGKTLLLDRPAVEIAADQHQVSIYGLSE